MQSFSFRGVHANISIHFPIDFRKVTSWLSDISRSQTKIHCNRIWKKKGTPLAPLLDECCSCNNKLAGAVPLGPVFGKVLGLSS